MRSYMIFIALLLVCNLTLSQSATIIGTVVNSDETPAEFATVLLYQATDSLYARGTISDSVGAFKFEDLKLGVYYVACSQVGNNVVYSDHLELSQNKQQYKVPTLKFQQGIDLQEVVVRSRKPIFELDAEKLIINVENSDLAIGNSALEVLQKSPGVMIDQDKRIILKGKQGVQVLFNGKNQFLTGNQLASMLENTPSSSIRSIEIIHNPSAKYEAEGNAGIINIELIKNENLGLNGSATINIGRGKNERGTSGLNMNYRTKQVNIYGSYNYSLWKEQSQSEIDRIVPFEKANTIFNQQTIADRTNYNHNYRVGVDYTLSNNTTIGALVRGGFGQEQNDNRTTTHISGQKPYPFETSSTKNQEMEEMNQWTGNLNLTTVFNETSKLNLDVDYGHYLVNFNVSYRNHFLDANLVEVAPAYLLRNSSDIGIDIAAIKLDFSKAFDSGLNMEVGGKTSIVQTRNGIYFEELVNEEWIANSSLSNTFQYQEYISAGYLNLARSLGKTKVQGGLRLEHTMSDGVSITLDTQVKRQYLELFPSLSISRPLSDNQTISISYSRRIDRPNYRQLNPFTSFRDQFTFQRGNPFLNPQFSNSYGINYSLGEKLFVSTNYSKTRDAITRIINQDDETQQTFQTNINFASFINYSLNVSAPVSIANWWISRFNTAGFINDYETLNDEREKIGSRQASFALSVNNQLSLSKKFVADISARYQSAMTYGIFMLRPQYFIDLGISTSVLSGRGRLSLSFKDVFNTLENGIVSKSGSIDMMVRDKRETQRVHLAFSYDFGNSKVKASHSRTTANREEENRAR